MGGVDLVQLARQGLELLGGHAGDGVEPGSGGGQVLNGPQGLFDGPGVFEQVGDQAQNLEHQQHPGRHGKEGHGTLNVQGDGVGLIPRHLHRVAGGAAGAEGGQEEEIDLSRVEVPHAPCGLVRSGQPFRQPVALAVPDARGDNVVARVHPLGGLRRGYAPLFHQTVDLGRLLLRPDEHAPAEEQGDEQIHAHIDAQQAEKEPGVEPQNDGGFGPFRPVDLFCCHTPFPIPRRTAPACPLFFLPEVSPPATPAQGPAVPRSPSFRR